MPLYDYKCDACQHTFEVSHPMSAPSPTECPKCQAHGVRKVLSTGGVLGSTKSGGNPAGPALPPCATGGCGSGMCGLG